MAKLNRNYCCFVYVCVCVRNFTARTISFLISFPEFERTFKTFVNGYYFDTVLCYKVKSLIALGIQGYLSK